MLIDKVLIVCFKKDVFLLRPCVASVRYWYPDIDIYILKDKKQGDFDTTEIEECFNVKVFKSKREIWGWGWAKIAPFIHDGNDRFLVLDSDTVLLGPVLDKLNQYKEDYIVTGVEIEDPESTVINRHYLDVKKVREFNPGYVYPGYGFNSGQMVVSAGRLNEKDFEEVLVFGDDITCKYPGVLKYNDQGVLNYVVAAAAQRNIVTVRHENFWIWPGRPETQQISLEGIKARIGTPYILHWAGVKPVNPKRYIRYDLLQFYENEYYKAVPNGKSKQLIRSIVQGATISMKILMYKLRRIEYAK